ncbi:MAG: hypothetical protein C0467_23270 [Planctomycetaceae bacterium]|nr:hypothetical protein [Planctomycetaceae bacterium]
MANAHTPPVTQQSHSRSPHDPVQVTVESAETRIERILTEGPIGLAGAARILGTIRAAVPVHPATIARWYRDGWKLASGRTIRLECIRVSGRLVTSRAALLRFLSAQQDDQPLPEQVPRSPAERTKASIAAAAELVVSGVK